MNENRERYEETAKQKCVKTQTNPGGVVHAFSVGRYFKGRGRQSSECGGLAWCT